MADLTLQKGEGKVITLTFTDDDGDAVDVSEATMTFVLKQSFTSTALVTVEDASFDKTDAGDGVVTFPLSTTNTTQTAGLYLAQVKAAWSATNTDISQLFTIEIENVVV